MTIGVMLLISANVFLWMTAAKDPATIPSRVSLFSIFINSNEIIFFQKYLYKAHRRKID